MQDIPIASFNLRLCSMYCLNMNHNLCRPHHEYTPTMPHASRSEWPQSRSSARELVSRGLSLMGGGAAAAAAAAAVGTLLGGATGAVMPAAISAAAARAAELLASEPPEPLTAGSPGAPSPPSACWCACCCWICSCCCWSSCCCSSGPCAPPCNSSQRRWFSDSSDSSGTGASPAALPAGPASASAASPPLPATSPEPGTAPAASARGSAPLLRASSCSSTSAVTSSCTSCTCAAAACSGMAGRGGGTTGSTTSSCCLALSNLARPLLSSTVKGRGVSRRNFPGTLTAKLRGPTLSSRAVAEATAGSCTRTTRSLGHVWLTCSLRPLSPQASARSICPRWTSCHSGVTSPPGCL
mmetsp:Transcript_19984/g.43577  ORF Transcript_19984/g.43577 Transcript_19984/m.43577 type:complete len:354 (-) Transcript_19984:1133-2194(-)